MTRADGSLPSEFSRGRLPRLLRELSASSPGTHATRRALRSTDRALQLHPGIGGTFRKLSLSTQPDALFGNGVEEKLDMVATL
mmetsp:Transcript_90645/g.230673  ORF Transcript_90645/g.230673 Transcript_90645/m.230673 type:complete len:83 (-) Transcript_90645:163-411(-)